MTHDALGQTAYAAFYTDEARLPWARLDESVREVYRRVGAAVAEAALHENDRLRAMVRGLADRVAAQSELLGRRAEGGA